MPRAVSPGVGKPSIEKEVPQACVFRCNGMGELVELQQMYSMITPPSTIRSRQRQETQGCIILPRGQASDIKGAPISVL